MQAFLVLVSIRNSLLCTMFVLYMSSPLFIMNRENESQRQGDEVNRRDVCECDGSPIDVFLKYHTYLDTSYLLTYLLNSWTCPGVIV